MRLLVVPALPTDDFRIKFDQLVPADSTMEKITQRLDETRLIGTRILVEPPIYRGVTVVARLRARSRSDPSPLQEQALDALFHYFHPIVGGPDGTGWPFGRAVLSGEVFAVLQSLRGTEQVEDVRVFGADPLTGERGKQTDRLEVEPHALVFSYDAPGCRRGCQMTVQRATSAGNRGLVEGYGVPWPLIEHLPGLYQDDMLARELTSAFDEVLAPALGTIDNFSAYLDPALTPEDFLDWLAGWVGLLPDENWPIERRRAIVALAAQLIPQPRHGQRPARARQAVRGGGGGDPRQRRRGVVDPAQLGHSRRAYPGPDGPRQAGQKGRRRPRAPRRSRRRSQAGPRAAHDRNRRRLTRIATFALISRLWHRATT